MFAKHVARGVEADRGEAPSPGRLDTRIKNTPEELASYAPAMDRLLDRVLDEYGLVVCGWSASWDDALLRAFERVIAEFVTPDNIALRPPDHHGTTPRFHVSNRA